MMFGIDISDNQGKIDWGKVKSDGVAFAILRSVRRSGKTDNYLDQNIKGCRANDIPFDFYKYSYALTEEDVVREANEVINALKQLGISTSKDFYVWFDCEDKTQLALGKQKVIKLIKAFKATIENSGFSFGLYMGNSAYKSIMPEDIDCYVWIARYPSSANKKLTEVPSDNYKPVAYGKNKLYGWQFSSKGVINGISNNVDLDVAYIDIKAENKPKTDTTDKVADVKSKTGKGLAEYAMSKLGTPYFYGAKMQTLTYSFMDNMKKLYPGTVTQNYINKAVNKCMVGKVCTDCSGLIGAYRGKQIGSSQLYSSAKKRLPISDVNNFAVGTILWKSGHVGVYVGNGYCVEAKGIDYGTIKSKVSDTKWTYGLTFDDISYDYDVTIDGVDKQTNPYEQPTKNLKKGSKGNDVKWLQFELNECGYGLVVDGDFGTKTHNALIDFQKSSKLVTDGICGKLTRQAILLV